MTDRFDREDLWSWIETAIWTFNLLAPIEGYYMEKNPGMFSSKTLIFFEWRKKETWTSRMTWGWVNYQDIFILEVKLSFMLRSHFGEISQQICMNNLNNSYWND